MQKKMSKEKNLKQIQSEQTTQKLINAATALILQKGYAGTTIALLAKAVGMTKGAIYHHFANKEAILRSVIAHVRNTWEREVGSRVPLQGDAITKLNALFEYQTQLINSDPTLCLLVRELMLESDAVTQEIRHEVSNIYEDFGAFICDILVSGQEAGIIRSDLSATDISKSLVTIISGISCSRATDISNAAFAAKMKTTKSIVLDGLKA